MIPRRSLFKSASPKNPRSLLEPIQRTRVACCTCHYDRMPPRRSLLKSASPKNLRSLLQPIQRTRVACCTCHYDRMPPDVLEYMFTFCRAGTVIQNLAPVNKYNNAISRSKYIMKFWFSIIEPCRIKLTDKEIGEMANGTRSLQLVSRREVLEMCSFVTTGNPPHACQLVMRCVHWMLCTGRTLLTKKRRTHKNRLVEFDVAKKDLQQYSTIQLLAEIDLFRHPIGRDSRSLSFMQHMLSEIDVERTLAENRSVWHLHRWLIGVMLAATVIQKQWHGLKIHFSKHTILKQQQHTAVMLDTLLYDHTCDETEKKITSISFPSDFFLVKILQRTFILLPTTRIVGSDCRVRVPLIVSNNGRCMLIKKKNRVYIV